MTRLISYLEGNKWIWGIVFLLSIFSLLVVYSASSNLAYAHHGGSTFSILSRHAMYMVGGLLIMYAVHKVNTRFLVNLSLILLPFAVLFLVITLFTGTTIADANAARWIRIPYINVNFQSSEFAKIALIMYVARYLDIERDFFSNFKRTFWRLYVPVFGVCMLILPANFSTAAILFGICFLLLFIGQYPGKYLLRMLAIAFSGLALFVLVVLAFPNISNRVDTWKSRIENFASPDEESSYQVTKAKTAIATGGLFGKGAGKSTQKNFLPQSTSDFIFAIIAEEWGFVGAGFLLLLYLMLFVQVLRIAYKADSLFGGFLVLGLGTLIMTQAMVNMGVAVSIFPVTGQPLPLVSTGGTNIWMTCVMLGLIVAYSRKPKLNNEMIHESA